MDKVGRFLRHSVDYQSWLKAKYCPRVAAALCTQKKTPKNHVTLTFNLTLNRVLEVVEVDVSAEFHRTKCSGS